MSKHTFTPGPWTQGVGCKVTRECVFIGGAKEPKDGARLGPPETWIDCGTEANARLIAAAPELLEALQMVRDYVVTLKGKGHPYQLAIDAAITKATGG